MTQTGSTNPACPACPACTPARLCDACRAGTPARARTRVKTRLLPTPPPPTEPVDLTPGPIIVLLGSAATFFGLWHLANSDPALAVGYFVLTTTIAVVTGVIQFVRVAREHGLIELLLVLLTSFGSASASFLESRIAAMFLTSVIAAMAGLLIL